MSTVAAPYREWITREEAARMLGIDWRMVDRLAETGHLVVRRLPGVRPRFARSSVESLAARYTTSGPGPGPAA